MVAGGAPMPADDAAGWAAEVWQTARPAES